MNAAKKAPSTGTKLDSVRKSRPTNDFGEDRETDSLRVPQIRFQLDNSDDGYYTSDDASNVDENWRHGDLKPDNILRFKGKGSSSLGTLKIGDLGLAKQHMLATSRRDVATQQKFSTLQYEAPEAITNMNLPVGRSRRYDIWSMGCIVLEFAIWLLYGWKGLVTFYEQRNDLDTSTETLYFTADKNNRTAIVSDYAVSWIEHILLNDPECNSPSGSAIRDLIKLVRDRLLVVALPQEGMNEEDLKQCRADAGELETALKSIWGKAVDDEAKKGHYIFSKSDRTDAKPPQRRQKGQNVDFLSTKIDRNRKLGGTTKNLVSGPRSNIH